MDIYSFFYHSNQNNVYETSNHNAIVTKEYGSDPYTTGNDKLWPGCYQQQLSAAGYRQLHRVQFDYARQLRHGTMYFKLVKSNTWSGFLKHSIKALRWK